MHAFDGRTDGRTDRQNLIARPRLHSMQRGKNELVGGQSHHHFPILSPKTPILSQNLKPPWAVSCSTTNFGGAYYKIYACFDQKTAFVMQNFRNLGLVGVGVTLFDETPKRYILA